MKFHLAQLNIARFRQPRAHPDNADFINSLDRVNATAESQPGFVWRFIEDDDDAPGERVFNDPNVAVNMSVWTDLESLSAFVYSNDEHLAIMRRRREWFDRMAFHLVLWWVKAGHMPTVNEAKLKLETLAKHGPSRDAFTFRQAFSPDGKDTTQAILNECA